MGALKRAIAAQQQQRQQPQQRGGAAGGSAAAASTAAAGEQGGAGGEEEEVQVCQADFLAAAEAVQPSLSAAEVAKYERLRDEYNSQAGGGGGDR